MASPRLTILDLPVEIRLQIFEYIYSSPSNHTPFISDPADKSLIINPLYRASTSLQLLLTCRRFYLDGTILALSQTPFLVTKLFLSIPSQLTTALADPSQLAALRRIAFVADARHFRALDSWGAHPFGCPGLTGLDELTLVLHRSGLHYLFDFTEATVALLRRLRGVRRLAVVRNGARVKGSFKTWYNRLVGLMLKVDHRERYERRPPALEETWWRWGFEAVAQRFVMEACPVKPWVEEAAYLESMLPLMEELRVSVENEEWNPDPRARTMYY